MKVMDIIQKGAKELKQVVSDTLLVKNKSNKSNSENSPQNQGSDKNIDEAIHKNEEELRKLQTKKEFYDFLEQPGQFEKAVEHGAAHRVYKIMDDIPPDVQIECCECCGLILPKKGFVEEYPLATSTSDMRNLGIGIFLYFFYMKFLLVALATIMGMYTIIEIATSVTYYNEVTNFCTKSLNYSKSFPCTDYDNREYIFMFKYTYVNVEFFNNYTNNISTRLNNSLNYTSIKDSMYVDYSFLNFLLMLILIIMNFIFCTLAYNLDIERDISKLSIDDYTAMISGLPLDCKNPDELIEAITCVFFT
jgi:hypothetical protein